MTTSTLISIENIEKKFGSCRLLTNVNASIERGSITAFIGPNGAGKTTLFHIIAGALRPDAGSIKFNGTDIAGAKPYRVASMGLGRQFQDVRVFGGLSVLDNLLVAMAPINHQDSWRAWFGSSVVKSKTDEHKEKAMSWLEHVGLVKDVNRLARDLSFGQQKLLTLARLFAHGFSVLLLDEPTAGVNPKMVEDISNLIQSAVEERGTTVALVEHNMGVVKDLAHWCHFMHEGRVVFSGQSNQILSDPNVRQIYMGI